MGAEVYSLDPEAFGRHVKSLRAARGLTQEALAKRTGLSSDTIRRLENGVFSPSLTTLVSMAKGFELRLSTVFEAFELRDVTLERELRDLMAGRGEREWRLAMDFVRALLEFLEADGEE